MRNALRQLAIIGPTASGKSALALEIARAYGAIILSLDSLALYRHIDIASAKPTPGQRGGVPHYGIDILDPDEPFDVTRFLDLYRDARLEALRRDAPLIVVGGSGFYLKILIEGISPLPDFDRELRDRVAKLMEDLPRAYAHLRYRDPDYARQIEAGDRYRIEKALLILERTGERPGSYFRAHPPVTTVNEPLPVFEISMDRERLRRRIEQRTDAMLREGLVDEVAWLEARYTRRPNPMKAIGIREVLAYFDGIYDYDAMRRKIIVDTARLAKRQRTFNRSQFVGVVRDETEALYRKIEAYLGTTVSYRDREEGDFAQ